MSRRHSPSEPARRRALALPGCTRRPKRQRRRACRRRLHARGTFNDAQPVRDRQLLSDFLRLPYDIGSNAPLDLVASGQTPRIAIRGDWSLVSYPPCEQSDPMYGYGIRKRHTLSKQGHIFTRAASERSGHQPTRLRRPLRRSSCAQAAGSASAEPAVPTISRACCERRERARCGAGERSDSRVATTTHRFSYISTHESLVPGLGLTSRLMSRFSTHRNRLTVPIPKRCRESCRGHFETCTRTSRSLQSVRSERGDGGCPRRHAQRAEGGGSEIFFVFRGKSAQIFFAPVPGATI